MARPEQRPKCRHGVTPRIEQDWVDIGGGGPFSKQIPGRATLIYDCPTPAECADAAYRQLIGAGIPAPPD
jgi:hypothetical protein